MMKYRYIVVDALIDGKMKYAIQLMAESNNYDVCIAHSRWYEKREDADALIRLKENTGGIFE